MRITKNFDSERSIEETLNAIAKEINHEKMFPMVAPKQLIEGEEKTQFCDDEGKQVYAYYGAITQQFRRRSEEEVSVELHYAVYPFGFAINNIPISAAIDYIDSEIESNKGVPIGEIQVMKVFSGGNAQWKQYGGFVVQAYVIDSLARVFK